MLYYAQRLLGPMGQATGDDLAASPAIFHTGSENDQSVQASIDGTDHLHTYTEEGGEQPSLSEIIRAVHKCTASVNTFGRSGPDPPGLTKDERAYHCS